LKAFNVRHLCQKLAGAAAAIRTACAPL
jgi:hypothetical protein